jgi:hypothetical protein
MARLITNLAAGYGDEPTYQMLVRVFHEHFTAAATGWRLKVGPELSATSLNSPDDMEATFRRKGTNKHTGYMANVSETCDPTNAGQLDC